LAVRLLPFPAPASAAKDQNTATCRASNTGRATEQIPDACPASRIFAVVQHNDVVGALNSRKTVSDTSEVRLRITRSIAC